MPEPSNTASTTVPTTIGRPALRALDAAGIRTLSDVSAVTEAQVLALHGVGPRAVTLLRGWLEEHGQQFKTG
jgi:predicted Fe-Mo cluster-binding NifX family protein